jgi:glycosyltransferase involved in cell wall biosynthesis
MNYFYLKGFNQNMRVLQAYYPGLEPEVFEAVAPDHPVLNVLTVSRLSMSDRYKGVGLLIETVNRMHRDGIAVSLTIAGSGDAMDIFIKLAGPAVQFVQAPDDHELNLLYSRATVFALPSTHEGQGLVYIEALAFGLPIVALKETVAEEFLTDRENALLISQDADGLYEALRYFGENRNERNRMAVNARRSFEAMQINQRFNKLVATIVED